MIMKQASKLHCSSYNFVLFICRQTMTESSQNSKSENASATTQRRLLISPQNKSLCTEIINELLRPNKGEHAAKKRKGGVDVAYPSTIDALMVERIKTCYLKWLNKSPSTFRAYLDNEMHVYYRSFGQYLCMKVDRAKDVAVSSIAIALHCSNVLKM